ncbi:hypothetical protein CHUAL_002123 [Chamberlinius hualienensis]
MKFASMADTVCNRQGASRGRFSALRHFCLILFAVAGFAVLYEIMWWFNYGSFNSNFIYYKSPNNPFRSDCANINANINFTGRYNNVTGFPYPIVPDIVHLIKFRKSEIDFVEMINLRSIVLHHNPARILIHCNYCTNKTFGGKYWDMLDDRFKSVVEFVEMEEPTAIFGKKLSSVYHASDVARIKILMKYGGIFLDNDIYVVQGLHGFRHYEMALGWDKKYIGTQVIIAHKDARFLKYWLDSYHNYQGKRWYFNAGEYPTTSVLYNQPELVHRVKLMFGVHMLVHKLYKFYWPEWTNQFTVHLLIRHRSYLDKESPIKTFDEENIKNYNQTWGEMARLVLYGSPNIVY